MYKNTIIEYLYIKGVGTRSISYFVNHARIYYVARQEKTKYSFVYTYYAFASISNIRAAWLDGAAGGAASFRAARAFNVDSDWLTGSDWFVGAGAG